MVSAVVVQDELDATVREELGRAKAEIGLPASSVLHFRKLPHSKKIKICREISGFSIACISCAVVCKRKLEPFPDGGLPYITRPDPLYLWAVRLLLERVSWFVRDDGGGSSLVTFAHLTRFKTEKLHNYRAAVENSQTSIAWRSFEGHPFRINSPEQVHLLQLADCAASALYKAVEPDAYEITESRYLEELAPVLYRYRDSPVTSYGLKVFPASIAEAGQPLHFLRQM